MQFAGRPSTTLSAHQLPRLRLHTQNPKQISGHLRGSRQHAGAVEGRQREDWTAPGSPVNGSALAAADEAPGRRNAPATDAAAAAAASAAAASTALQKEVSELKTLVQRQAEQQQQALHLIQQQQVALRQLEERLPGSSLQAGAAPVPVAAWTEARQHHLLQQQQQQHQLQQQQQQQEQQLLEGPEAVMEPSMLLLPVQGSYSSRYNPAVGATWTATPRDLHVLPRRIVLVRHAQSKGNVDPFHYTFVPDPSVPLTAKGWEQALDAGERVKAMLDADGTPYRLFFYTSPYLRCKQTTEGLMQAFGPEQLLGVQEEVQLREQDFGNFQDTEGKKREKLERLRYGRFFYRFPHGESGADVYTRMQGFQDHLVRDMDAGRFGEGSTVVLVTHGLASRIFLQRWFHWTVQQFLEVWNPPNAAPIVMELAPRSTFPPDLDDPATSGMHTKALYRLSDASRCMLQGCTEDMCATGWTPRGMHWESPMDMSPPERPQASMDEGDWVS